MIDVELCLATKFRATKARGLDMWGLEALRRRRRSHTLESLRYLNSGILADIWTSLVNLKLHDLLSTIISAAEMNHASLML